MISGYRNFCVFGECIRLKFDTSSLKLSVFLSRFWKEALASSVVEGMEAGKERKIEANELCVCVLQK